MGKSYMFSLDPERLVLNFMADPSTREQLLNAVELGQKLIEEGKAISMTQPLGAINLSEPEEKDCWCTLWPATDRDTNTFWRPRNEKTKNRVLIRIKEQDKEQVAVPGTSESAITAQDLKDALNSENLSPAQIQSLRDLVDQVAAAEAKATVPEAPAIQAEAPFEVEQALKG